MLKFKAPFDVTGCAESIQELEDSLGEVQFRDGIPDVKFRRVRFGH